MKYEYCYICEAAKPCFCVDANYDNDKVSAQICGCGFVLLVDYLLYSPINLLSFSYIYIHVLSTLPRIFF